VARSLEGLRVLVVEDDYLISLLFDDMLTSAGCVVVGPLPRLTDALEAAAKERCDAAVLDVNLGGERVYPVAKILAERHVPFIFCHRLFGRRTAARIRRATADRQAFQSRTTPPRFVEPARDAGP
jgi:DNA-binding response OmpR family regulator